MTCEEAQGLIKPYIQGELKTALATEFAEHVGNCRSCKDDLEISYCVITATRQLNDEEEFSGNYILELNNLLLDTIKKAKRERTMIIRKRIGVVFELVLMGLLLGLRL